MNHVMIVGERASSGLEQLGDQQHREVLHRLRHTTRPSGFAFDTCCHPDELVGRIDRLTHDPIDLLDLYYHGGMGEFFLGGINPTHRLFGFDESRNILEGASVARQLAAKLSVNGHLRLLGCEVGAGRAGRRLLIALGHELGFGRIAFAPICDVDSVHFQPDGRYVMPNDLFSSLGALDREAPTPKEREFKTPRYP